MDWCTIESDPGVFSELIEKFGVKDVSVEEIYSLDSNEQKLGLSYGLIFLFKWKKEDDPRPVTDTEDIPQLFFARQVITNACATQAILSVLLNAADINLGETLSGFKEFTAAFDSECKGLAISNSDIIRGAHNSFASADPFVIEESKHAVQKGDAYHFVAYIPFQGAVYELDGLKAGPIHLGNVSPGEDWWSVAQPAIEERMARYSATETSFALQTICQSRTTVITKQIACKETQLEAVMNALEAGVYSAITLDDGYVLSDSADGLAVQQAQLEQDLEQLRADFTSEQQRVSSQREENVRRKHNFVPFIIALLKQLAAKKKLSGLLTKAVENRTRAAGQMR
mmetsp:Transcript_27758/g.28001  ORF Transcript_27758/g.28001 Transcript_27758/m.28001 type:complete len:341 (+) Transcript_27758:60-1082(+)|eukprot:CAMPEP_0182428322 /NCGR_PEP_ID=MMETSP1167-20130531/22257_1 /TAXON_ID=2988 /ORGANISM="Mallomonas Sp, Strain CCMP3275" /LENGTH=340 /DNA_ID=CAMNT_0024611139 /DNA_START=60 /DNA_END=1082 /DNA_ORIENTATION=+